MNKKIKHAHQAQIKALGEIKDLLEAQIGQVKLIDVLDYITFCNQTAEEQFCLIKHIKKDVGVMYG